MSTSTVAIIGCITGVISLTINLIRFWNERFDVRICFNEPICVFFHKLSSYDLHNTEYQCLIQMRFENRSSTPVTVFSIKPTLNGHPLIIQKVKWPGSKQDHLDFRISENRLKRIPLGQELETPLRIEPYDACEGYIFLPVFPSIESDTARINLTAETTKKKVEAITTVRFIGIRS